MARLRSLGADQSGRARDPSRRSGEAGASSPTRRNRVTLGVAAAVALVVLATSFPFSGLFSQHRQLAAAASQLNQLRRTNQSLAAHQRQLDSPAAVAQLARERYQLVPPGATIYEVLPPGGRSGPASAAPTTGDPANQPLVAPSNAPDLSPDPNLSSPAADGSGSGQATTKGAGSGQASSASGPASSPSSFWSRVSHTLEFWR